MKLSTVKSLWENSLYKNSFYLIASNMIQIGSGFLFWIIVARLYSTSEIGIATSLYSLLTLLSILSILGFNSSILHFLPTSNFKKEKINSTLLITSSAAFLLACVTIISISKLSPQLSFINHNIFYTISFIAFTILFTLNLQTEAILTAFRQGNHVLIKNSLLSILKLALPFILLPLGAYGIFSSIELAALLPVIYGLSVITIVFKIRYRPALHIPSIKKMSFFAFGNYVSGLAHSAPTYILPIFITNILGPSPTAYYYMAATTANVLFMIPTVVTQNLLVEGSHQKQEIATHSRKAMWLIITIVTIGILAIWLFGNYVLLVFGKNYSGEGINLLKLLALSGIFLGISYVLNTILTILHHIKLLIFLNIINAVLILLLSYFFINLKIGLIGIGYAAIIAQTVSLILYIISFYKIGKQSLLFSLIPNLPSLQTKTITTSSYKS